MIRTVKIEYEMPIDLLAALHEAHGSLLDEGGCIITQALWHSVRRMEQLFEAFEQENAQQDNASELHPAGHEEPAGKNNLPLKGRKQ